MILPEWPGPTLFETPEINLNTRQVSMLLEFGDLDFDFVEIEQTSLDGLAMRLKAFLDGCLSGAFIRTVDSSHLAPEQMLLWLADQLGSPVTFPESKYGPQPIHVIQGEAINLAKGGQIDWHTEDAYTLSPPRFFALYCVVGDERVQTVVGQYGKVDLEAKEISALLSRTHLSTSDSSLYKRELKQQVPILFETPLGYGVRFDPGLIGCFSDPDGGCPARKIGISRLKSFTLQPGNLLLLNNHMFAHARAGSYDISDRRLLRIIAD